MNNPDDLLSALIKTVPFYAYILKLLLEGIWVLGEDSSHKLFGLLSLSEKPRVTLRRSAIVALRTLDLLRDTPGYSL